MNTLLNITEKSLLISIVLLQVALELVKYAAIGFVVVAGLHLLGIV